MNFSSLNYFIVLHEEKNFTRAAKKLHITQQTLSAHIRQLEKEIGCELVIRQNPLQFTWPGQVFYRHAMSLRQGEDDMKKALADAMALKTGVLRVGIAPNRAHAVLGEALLRYAEKYPQVQVEVQQGNNSRLLYELTEGRMDLAIVNVQEPITGIVSRPFYEEAMILLLPKKLAAERLGQDEEKIKAFLRMLEEGDAKELAQLADYPFLLPGEGTVIGSLIRRLFAAADCAPFIRLSSDNLRLLMMLSAQGLGITVCPENLIHRNLTPEALNRVYPFRLHHGSQLISFCYREGLENWQLLRDFLSITAHIQNKNKDAHHDNAV